MIFEKWQGAGNDFVVLAVFPDDPAAFAVRACDRRLGIGGDGVLAASREGPLWRMRMWNPDGSEAEMCGNGLRCFARFVRALDPDLPDRFPVLTGAGILEVEIVGDRVRTDLGPARFPHEDLPFVDLGNPHLVWIVPDVTAVDLETEGPRWERDARFPARTNVHFAQALDRDTLRVRHWERGAGATLACGTGIAATAAWAHREGLVGPSVRVLAPGGEVFAEVGATVSLLGPAGRVYDGVFDA